MWRHLYIFAPEGVMLLSRVGQRVDYFVFEIVFQIKKSLKTMPTVYSG